MYSAKRIWHDLEPVKRALNNSGICWKVVGEVVAWNSHSRTARTFVSQWSKSDSHWPLLMAGRYDRGGGSYVGWNGYNVAAYYVLDLC